MLKVCGKNEYSQLGEGSNNEVKDLFGQDSIISPPLESHLDISSILSFSVYLYYSILITRDGKMQAIGSNSNGEISKSINQTKLVHYTNFEIKDSQGRICTPISALCGFKYSLYIISTPDNRTRLVYSYDFINEQYPLFLNIGDSNPISIFGGENNSAAIDTKGRIIFIPYKLISESPNTQLKAISLPGGIKAVSVSCCNDIIIALGTNGKLYESPVQDLSIPTFSEVSQFQNSEIIEISGISDHCFAVNKEGEVFGRGSNIYGRLGLDQQTDDVENFVEISSLKKFKISEAYAGFNHSLFRTNDGKILACGANMNGELLLDGGPSEDNVFDPIETTIKSDACFCIAGCYLSAVFIGNCPPNCPNKKIEKTKFEMVNEKEPSPEQIEIPVETNNTSSKCCLLL